MVTPQDWAPYPGLVDAAKVYLRDPDIALDQLRAVVDFTAIKAFVMDRRTTDELWGESLWQEVVLTDGRRLIMWHAVDQMSDVQGRESRHMLDASVRTILLSSITDQSLTAVFEVLADGTRRLLDVRLRLYTQLVTRSHRVSATDSDLYCESFRYSKSVDNGRAGPDGAAHAVRQGAVPLHVTVGCSLSSGCSAATASRSSSTT